MKHFILASHGRFSKGIYESIKIIIGEQPNVHIVCGYVDDNDVKEMIKETIEKIPYDADIIAISDLFGGSINNELMNYSTKENFYLVAGMNLPLLMELFLSTENDCRKRIQNAVSLASSSIVFCNDKLDEKISEEDF